MLNWEELEHTKNFYVSIVIDAKFDKAQAQSDLLMGSRATSVYGFELGTEIVWYQEAVDAMYALISARALLDYTLRRMGLKKARVLSLRVLTEEARKAELEKLNGTPDQLPEHIEKLITESMNSPSARIKRERPKRKSN